MSKAKEEYSYGFILEVLTQGLYPNILDVVREYVQNAYDAILKQMRAEKSDDYKIKINIINRSLFIIDNGIGMNEAQIKQYRYVGFSEKKLGEEAGYRGIGKLSGISVADKLIVTSTTPGSNRAYTITFKANAMLSEIMRLKIAGDNIYLSKLIDDNTEIASKPASVDSHYTSVELHNIREEHSLLLDAPTISDYISKICPVPFNKNFRYEKEINRWLLDHVSDYVYIPHLVNDKPVFKLYTNNVNAPEYFEIDDAERERSGNCVRPC